MVDWESYTSLAVAKLNKEVFSGNRIKVIIELKELFRRQNITKSDVVNILGRHIPTFDHIEKGMSLDLKM
ncbi:MAG: hypothetical protein WKG06_07000 [Segetibacter sp.]